MATKELTPAELTFHSFRHSQGNGALQVRMLRYLEDQTGVSPSFEQDKPTLERYYTFLGGNAARRHALVIYPSAMKLNVSLALSGMKAEFEGVEKSLPITDIPGLTSAVVSNEQQRFGLIKASGLEAQKLDRAVHRLNIGQHSFLEYYGGEAQNTGFDALNTMYVDMWKYYQSSSFSEEASLHKELALGAELKLRDLLWSQEQATQHADTI